MCTCVHLNCSLAISLRKQRAKNIQWDNEKIDKTICVLRAPKYFQPSLTLILCVQQMSDGNWFANMFWFHFFGGKWGKQIVFVTDFYKIKYKSKAFCSRVQMSRVVLRNSDCLHKE